MTVCARFSDKALRPYKKAGMWAPRMIGPFGSMRVLIPLGYCAATGDGLYGDEDVNSVLNDQLVFSLSAAILLTICAYSSDTIIERAQHVYLTLCDFTPFLKTYLPYFKDHPDELIALLTLAS